MRNTACKALGPRIGAHVDGELPPAERAEVEAHLARCEDCARLAGEIREVDRLAASQVVPPVASAEWALLRERLLHRIDAPGGRIIQGPALRRWALAAAAAAVLIGLAGAWIFLADREAPPLESFGEWLEGAPPAKIESDGETLYIKYEEF
jgi:anti-sigma factor RsiW